MIFSFKCVLCTVICFFYVVTYDLLVLQEKNVLPQEKKDDQKTVDTPLFKAIEGVTDLKTYLAARFSLKHGMKPHELVF